MPADFDATRHLMSTAQADWDDHMGRTQTMADDRESYFPLVSGDPLGAATLLVEKDVEIERLREIAAECERLRAQRDRRQYEALGFAYAWACSLLDRGLDPRKVDVAELSAQWAEARAALGAARGKDAD